MLIRRIIASLMAAAVSEGVPVAHAESSAQVIGMQPLPDAELGRDESLWVRIAYSSDEPINLWVRPDRKSVV